MSYFATTRRGIYFALLTLIFAEVVYTVFRYTQTFGGSDGIQGLPAPSLLPGVPVDTPARNYYLILAYLFFAYLVCRTLVSSHFGRVLAAIRENEDRARFLGYDVQRYKMGVCMISAVLTGLAGALYPGRAAYATPDLLHWSISGEFLIMVMIGGLGTLVGPIIGGAFFIVLQEKVSSYVQWYSMVVGLVLIFIVLFVPKGLLGFRGRPAAARLPARLGMSRNGVLLQVEGVSKSFGALAALTDVSLTVSAGEVVSVIGPNGAGKSTLFNVITGLHGPSRGRVLFHGQVITGRAPEEVNRLGLAKTFQITNVFPGISVYENVRVAAQSRAPEAGRFTSLWRRPDVEGAVMELLVAFGLEGRRDESCAEPLSRRAALSRDLPGPGHAADPAPPGRADRRHDARGDQGGDGADPPDGAGPGPDAAADRARHERRHGHLRPRRGAPLRPEDRRGTARGDPQQPAGHRSVPRWGR